MLGQTAHRILTPEDNAAGRVEAEMRLTLVGGRGTDERWHLRKDGSRFRASGEVTPLRDAGCAVAGLLKILRDRTKQRLAEEERRRLTAVVGHSSDLIGIAGPDGRAFFVNEAGRRMMGSRASTRCAPRT